MPVAFVSGQPAGIGRILPLSRREDLATKGHVWGISVKTTHRGKGIGRTLLEELLRCAAPACNQVQITLAVTEQQAAARTLYLHLGSQIYRREPQASKVGKACADVDLEIPRAAWCTPCSMEKKVIASTTV